MGLPPRNPQAVEEPGAWFELSVPQHVEVVVEVPRGSFVKRGPGGGIDFVAPLPCPFNYGSVPSILAPDGDPLDAVVLGPTLPYGHVATWRVCGLLKFVDAGSVDNKLICLQGGSPPAALQAGHAPPPSGIRTLGRFAPGSGEHLVERTAEHTAKASDVVGLCTPVRTVPARSAGRRREGGGLRGRGTRRVAPHCGCHGQPWQEPCAEDTGSRGRRGERLDVAEFLLLTAFFSSYGVLKGALNSIRGRSGRTAFEGWDLLEQ